MLAFSAGLHPCLLAPSPASQSLKPPSATTVRSTAFLPASVNLRQSFAPPCPRPIVTFAPITYTTSAVASNAHPSPAASALDEQLKPFYVTPNEFSTQAAAEAAKPEASSKSLSKPLPNSSIPHDDFTDDIVTHANDSSSPRADHSSPEEEAIYALLSDSHTMTHHQDLLRPKPDDNSAVTPSIHALRTGVFEHDRPVDFQHIEQSRQPQSHPRLQTSDRLQRAMDAVRRRRAKLAAERAEDTLASERFSHASGGVEVSSLATGRLGGGVGETDAADRLFADLRHAVASDVVALSLKSALPVDAVAEARSPHCTAITSAIAQHVRIMSGAPRIHRPFLALQESLYRVYNPPCVRCAVATPRPSVVTKSPLLCDACYSKIYVQTPFADSPTRVDAMDGVFLTRGERLRQQQVLAEQAAAVVHSAVSASQDASAGNGSAVPLSSTATAAKGKQGVNVPSGPTGTQGGGVGKGGMAANVWEDGWNVSASDRSLRTINPIRNLVQNINVTPNPSKKAIKLSIGDPTVYGNLVVSDTVLQAFSDAIWQRRANGYSMSMGNVEARRAVAQRYSTAASPLTEEDVLLTCGTSGALEIALSSLANEGDNILLPRPGFPLFQTLAENLGVECRYYRLTAESGWEAELGDISAAADGRTRAIVVNNPSNPCGSVFSRRHVEDITAVAASLRLPIIADEVYADMVFDGGAFTSFGEASVDVPVLCVGGISKQFVVPGWRLGWVLVHDRGDVFARGDVRKGLRQLTTRMMTPNTPVQAILPVMLDTAPGFPEVMQELSENAAFAMDRLKDVPGLTCVRPSGAMYMMVGVDVEAMRFKDDMEFVEKLYEEEAVFVLPGQCFQLANFVRIVFAAPKEVLADAFDRMAEFCVRRMK